MVYLQQHNISATILFRVILDDIYSTIRSHTHLIIEMNIAMPYILFGITLAYPFLRYLSVLPYLAVVYVTRNICEIYEVESQYMK